MNSLDRLEVSGRAEVLSGAGERQKVSPFAAFLMLLFASPFLLCAAVFIPILGQILALIALALSAILLRLRGSFAAVVGALLGCVASGGVIAVLLWLNPNFKTGIFYTLLGGAVAVSLVYLVVLSAMIWWHYEAAAERVAAGGK